MKKVIRLTENDLVKIVERVISEQKQTNNNVFATPGNTPVGWNTLYRATSILGTNELQLEKVFSDEIRNKADFDALEAYLAKGPVQGYNYKSIQDVLNGELGDFDRATLDRIAANIQKKTGYTVTYTPDSKRNSIRANTIRLTKGGSPKNTPTKSVSDTPTPTPTPSKPAQTTQWVKAPSEQEVIAGTKKLKPGTVGDVVTKIQQALGFTGRNLDGKFGNNTFNAVKKFQQEVGLEDNGIVGSDTYTILFRPKVEKTNIASKGLKPVAPGMGQQAPQMASRQTGVDDFS